MKKIIDVVLEKRYLVLFTVFGLHCSSMGAVTSWVLEPEKTNSFFGICRGIRSDEYAVDTMFATSQYKNGFNQNTELIANGNKDLFLTIYVPVKSILSLFRIHVEEN